MAHRGPDDEGCYLQPGIALGFRRLAIVDLQHGHQPMTNEDGSIWVVQNGEIYNHLELRRELDGAGHRYGSRSDAEILVHGYEQWGMEGLLARLRGMFAFLLWDARMKRLYAARDRFGIKPLYHAEQEGRLYLASGIRPILEASGLDRRFDFEALPNLLSLGFTPAPRTLFRNVMKLPAAHLLEAGEGRFSSRCYWRLSYASRLLPPDAVVEGEFRERLDDALSSHLMSDVPRGALLSGGVDSATIVSRMCAAGHPPSTAITISFRTGDLDERDRAEACARALAVDHTVFTFGGDLMDDFPSMVEHLEEPVSRATFAALYHLFRVCHERGLKVVMTGEGADELLGGYAWHSDPCPPGCWWSRSPALLRAASSGRSPRLERIVEWIRQGEESRHTDDASLIHRYARHLSAGAPGSAFRLLSGGVMERLDREPLDGLMGPWTSILEESGHRDPFQRLLWLQARTRLPDYVNAIVDRMSMAHSVEARPPFLDHRLWDYCAGLPRRLKVRGYPPNQAEKFILRQSMRGLVPEMVRSARKMPLQVPFSRWLAQERLPDWAEEALSWGAINDSGLFDPSGIAGLRQSAATGTGDSGTALMLVLTLQLWMRIFGCRL